jgi:hypothetical protein
VVSVPVVDVAESPPVAAVVPLVDASVALVASAADAAAANPASRTVASRAVITALKAAV